MEKWTPIFWIIGSGVGFLLLSVLMGQLRIKKKKK